jgi:glycosyltransferase involved in cell wall biosynthesis
MLSIPPNPDLTILVIAFNEEDAIGATVEELLAVQERLGFYARVLVLDDGSTDRTAEIADALAARHERVDVFHHPSNVGQFANIRKGLELTETRNFTLIPGDGQFDVSRFDLFLSCLESHDVIFGFPNNEEIRGRKRVVLSHAWRLYLLVLYGVSVTYLAGWVFAPTDLVKRIPVRYGAFLGWYELATKLVLSGASYMQMPFDMRPRRGGETKALNPLRNLTDLVRMLHVWWRSKGPGVLPGGRDYPELRQIYRDFQGRTTTAAEAALPALAFDRTELDNTEQDQAEPASTPQAQASAVTTPVS